MHQLKLRTFLTTVTYDIMSGSNSVGIIHTFTQSSRVRMVNITGIKSRPDDDPEPYMEITLHRSCSMHDIEFIMSWLSDFGYNVTSVMNSLLVARLQGSPYDSSN